MLVLEVLVRYNMNASYVLSPHSAIQLDHRGFTIYENTKGVSDHGVIDNRGISVPLLRHDAVTSGDLEFKMVPQQNLIVINNTVEVPTKTIEWYKLLTLRKVANQLPHRVPGISSCSRIEDFVQLDPKSLDGSTITRVDNKAVYCRAWRVTFTYTKGVVYGAVTGNTLVKK